MAIFFSFFIIIKHTERQRLNQHFKHVYTCTRFLRIMFFKIIVLKQLFSFRVIMILHIQVSLGVKF